MTDDSQDFVTQLTQVVGSNFATACGHKYLCRCDLCLDWWMKMGPGWLDDDTYGPFTVEEVEAAKKVAQVHPGFV